MTRSRMIRKCGMMRRRGTAAVLLLVAALAVVGAGCGRGAPARPDAARVELNVAPSPPLVGPARVEVRLADGTGQPVAGAAVQVEGNMTHAGMKPEFAEARDAGAGRYLAEGFRFTMSGDWVLTVRATLPGGQRVERTFPVNGVVAK